MRTALSLLAPYTRGRRLVLARGLAGTLLATGAALAQPFPLKVALDRLLAGPDPNLDALTVAFLCVSVIVIAAVGAAGGYLSEAGVRTAGEHVVHDLRVDLYTHMQRLSLRFHHRRPTGDLVTRLTGDVNSVGELVGESAVKTVGSVLLLAGMLAVSLTLDPVLTLVAVAVAPLLATASIRARRTVKASARRQRDAEGAIAAASTEALGAIATVKALGSEVVETQRLRQRSETRRDAGVRGSVAEGRFAGVVDVLEALGTALVLGVGVARVSAGILTPGDLVVMHSYVRRLYRPLRDLARQAGRIARAFTRVERIAEVLAAGDTLPERPHAYAGDRALGAISLRDLSFRYQPDRPALRDVSLEVPAGTTVAVVGRSGAGKSTLASLLGRFHDPDQGAVLIDGRDLRGCSHRWLRDQVGFVLQDTALFSGTVTANIAYGVDATPGEIVAAARASGAHEFIEQLSDGYDTMLGPAGVGLSGGQRQRIAIARTLLRDPPIVVLDEPTSGLDADSEHTVIDALERLLRTRTTVLITHSLRLARRADVAVVLDRGRIVEHGRPDTLLARGGLFRHLAAQQGVATVPALPAPRDSSLPRLATLLDPDAMRGVLAAPLARPVLAVNVRYVRYKPHTNCVADYDVETATGTVRAVVMIATDRDLARRAARPSSRVASTNAQPRAPTSTPLAYVAELDALVQWLPLDLWLPALAEPPHALAHAAGLRLDHAHQADLVAYKPRRRAVLRLDGHVLKLYADQPAFRAAATALLAGHRLTIPTAPAAGVAQRYRLTAQARVPGTPIDDPLAAAPQAGALLAALHHSRPILHRPLDPLSGARAAARSVGALMPGLRPRLDQLVDRLAAAAPTAGATQCHGDFHARQLVVHDGTLTALDFDESGIGWPAADLASYAAHQLDGASGDRDRLDVTLDALVDGYGGRPDHLSWHASVAVLRRAVFPFRSRPSTNWPERIETMLTTAEHALQT